MAEEAVKVKNLMGGHKEVDPNDPDIREHLTKVLSMQNCEEEFVRILSAKKQVVAGTKYTVEFEAKNPKSQEIKAYFASYLLQPWISKEPQILEFKLNA